MAEASPFEELSSATRKQREWVNRMLVGTEDHEVDGALDHLRHLSEIKATTFMNPQNRLGTSKGDMEKFNQARNQAIEEADFAISDFSEAINFFPTCSQLYLLRGEAFRARAQLSVVAKADYSHSELASSTKTAFLRRALSDVEHVLRFWEPRFVEMLPNKLPMGSIEDLKTIFPKKTEQQIDHLLPRNVYAKAWLQRGNIRADLACYASWKSDFELAQKLSPADPQIYLTFGRWLWRKKEWPEAREKYEEAINNDNLPNEAHDFFAGELQNLKDQQIAYQEELQRNKNACTIL